jgi:hypothetical protein
MDSKAQKEDAKFIIKIIMLLLFKEIVALDSKSDRKHK